jgi:hypothetical protein
MFKYSVAPKWINTSIVFVAITVFEFSWDSS